MYYLGRAQAVARMTAVAKATEAVGANRGVNDTLIPLRLSYGSGRVVQEARLGNPHVPIVMSPTNPTGALEADEMEKE